MVEFAADQAVDFEDGAGRLIRLRFQPSYRQEGTSGGLAYGLLSTEEERTPDVSIEVFSDPARGDPAPDVILIFDAKYTSVPHYRKLEEVRQKYGRVGVFETGRVLSRQLWALVPGLPGRPQRRGPDWSVYCTVDNSGFWSERYDMASATAGVVQCRPRIAGRKPLEGLVRLLLRRAGVAVRL